MNRRIGVVGLGNAARSLHLPALRELGVERIAGVDPDPQRRADAERDFGVEPHADLAALLERGVDVVLIGTPPETHAELSIAALEAGSHVICEKPFATGVEEADRILEAAAAAGRRVALNHEFRHVPMYEALHDAIGTSDVGALRVAQAWQNMDLPPWREAGWRSELLVGTLFEAGIHLLDYLVHLFGDRPRAVTATMSSCGAHESESDAVAFVTLEFAGGRLGHIVQNRLCPGDLQYFEVRADCERASLRASFGGRARLSAGLVRSTRPHARLEWGASGLAWSERGPARRRLARNPREPAMVGTRELLSRTLSALDAGGEPPVSGEDGRLSIEILAACYLSAREGRRVELGDAPDPALREWRLA